MNSFFNDPFDMLLSSRYYNSNPRVIVVSDTEYNELRQKEAERQALALENKANRYFTAAQELEARVAEIRKEHNLLEGSDANKELSASK